MLDNQKSFSQLFEEINTDTNNAIKNDTIFTQNWLPLNLIGRMEILSQLILIYKGIYQQNTNFSSNTLVLGEIGSGKTTLVKYFVTETKKELIKNNIAISVCYFDCGQFRTISSMLRFIYDQYFHNEGHGYKDVELMTSILTHIKKNNITLFLILDEFQLIDMTDLFGLLNSSIAFGDQYNLINCILISRNDDWIKIQNELILSRIHHIIRLNPYSLTDIKKILQERINIGLKYNIIPKNSQLFEQISQFVFEHQNIRFGIDLIRMIGLYCSQFKLHEFPLEKLTEFLSNMKFQTDLHQLANLKIPELMTLYASFLVYLEFPNEPITTDRSYPKYQEICREYEIIPHVIMSYRKYLRHLSDFHIIKLGYDEPHKKVHGRRLNYIIIINNINRFKQTIEQLLPKKKFKY